MSALGQKQTFALQNVMSAYPQKADMCGALAYVRFVPIADIETIPTSSALVSNDGGTVRPGASNALAQKLPKRTSRQTPPRTKQVARCREELLKMLIAPTQSATPMPRQVNRRIYFHTIIAASKDPSRDQRPVKCVSCDKHAPPRHAPLADRTAVTPRVSLSPANVRGPFSPLWPPPPCFRKRQASFLAAPTDRHDRSPTSMP